MPARVPGRAAGALLVGWTCVSVLSCAGRAPREVAIGEAIAIGPYAFSVQGAGLAPDPPPPLSTFRDQPGKKAVVVTVRWTALPGNLDFGRRRSIIEGILRHQVSLSDSAGRRTLPDGAIPASFVRGLDAPPDWDEWAVVFYVPEDSRELALVVENPEPREGQARVTMVRLGM